MKPTLLDAINALIENAAVSVYGDENEDFKVLWLNGTKPISNEKILEKLKDLNTDYDAKQYQRDRALAYPPLAEQMDILYHGGVDALKAELKKTKDKYPKP